MMLGLARDITERKRAETALRASEERYRNLVEHAPDAFFVIDPDDGSILDVNDVACRWLGYLREALLRLKVMDIDKSAGLSGLRRLWSGVQLGNVELLESKVIRGDGSEFPVELRAGLTDHDGSPAMHVLVRDITDQKRQRAVAEQLRQKAVAARELHLQNRELTRANHVIPKFLGTLSHELNTPLTSLIAFTDILRRDKEGNLTLKQKQQLGAMNRSGTQLSWLISQLLDATTIEAGTLKLTLDRFDIADVIREAVDCYSPTLIDKNQSLGIRGFDEPHYVEGDRGRLVQILTNLISNASKYSPVGSHIVISIEPHECSLRILVKDDGPGISQDDQKRIFEAFYRADNVFTRSESGTGLGLSIVKSLVEAHGGKTWITSPSEGGTEIGFSLPLRSSLDSDGQLGCIDAPADEAASKLTSSQDTVQ
jgi:PAS domain S-box-containing protein